MASHDWHHDASASHVPESNAHDVGAVLREVRVARRQTLREVATAADLSESFLSQIERGKATASIAALRRIASVYGMTLGDLFDEGPSNGVRLMRAQDRPELSFGVLGSKFQLHPVPHRGFDVLLCEFEPGGSTGDEAYAHGDSEEVAVVVSGAVEMQIDDTVLQLKVDDSVAYRSSSPHRLTADPVAGARVMFITVPPSL